MKILTHTLLLMLCCITLSFSQDITQTVRGIVTDVDNKLPIIGAEVIVLNSKPLVGMTTDENGGFRFDGIALGRINLGLSYLGYESKSVTNIIVDSGKEVVLNIEMQESILELNEIVVKANKEKGKAQNDMSLLSSRSISPEETKRFAGGFDDPSRILANFAGVTNTQDGSNDIIVRGNSPKYIQWRLEGIEITNPNHFSDQNAMSGGVSALNNNLLTTSDFYTGAFSPEYGDVLSGVYDVKLRAGNNERFEATAALGLIGTDITLEGPLKKGYGGSYLINYRYSTIGLISDLGLVDIAGDLSFQDAVFKVLLPTKEMGVFSFFGLGGLSSFSFEDIKPDLWVTPGEPSAYSEDFDKQSFLSNLGMNHTISINDNSYLKTSISYSSNGIKDDLFETQSVPIYDNAGLFVKDSIVSRDLNYKGRLNNSIYRGALTYSNKVNAKHKIQAGVKYNLNHYDNEQSNLNDETNERFSIIDFNENISTVRNFISWKYRLNEDVTFVTGLHNMNVLFNNKSTLEPRLAMKWKINNTNSFHLGYGNHSTMESIHNYFTKVELDNGDIIQPNKDLGLLRANHFVLGYEKRLNQNLLAKVELYYQQLYNLPVENNDTSFYATINEDIDYKYVDLVNEGTGKNYGLEITLERFLNNNFYFLVNGSLYTSKYKSLEGIERNTTFNGNYLFNGLIGKEFINMGKNKNKTLAINAKLFYGGGKKYIPLLRDTNGELAVNPSNNQFWDYSKAYENKIEDAYQINLAISYKINKSKTTHEIFLNLENITNHKGRIDEFYDESEPNSVGYRTQFGFFPNLLYRVYF